MPFTVGGGEEELKIPLGIIKMEIIKNIYKLVGIVSHIEVLRLEQAARQYLSELNISFEIITARSAALKIRTRQWNCKTSNYADIPKLISLTQELFERFITDIPVTVYPIAYIPVAADHVEPEWINGKMLNLGVTLKDIHEYTGIDQLNLSLWVKGTLPLNQDAKSLFFYYFEYIQQIKNQNSKRKEFIQICYN